MTATQSTGGTTNTQTRYNTRIWDRPTNEARQYDTKKTVPCVTPPLLGYQQVEVVPVHAKNLLQGGVAYLERTPVPRHRRRHRVCGAAGTCSMCSTHSNTWWVHDSQDMSLIITERRTQTRATNRRIAPNCSNGAAKPINASIAVRAAQHAGAREYLRRAPSRARRAAPRLTPRP